MEIYFLCHRLQQWLSLLIGGLNFYICGGRWEPAPKIDQIFLKILLKYLKRSPWKTGTPKTWFTCCYVEKWRPSVTSKRIECYVQRGLGSRPPNMTAIFCGKVANTSALPLTVLECSYRNFPCDRIFSIYHPLADGDESMRISAPYPEIWAPKVGKMWGLVYKQCMHNFFRFLASALPYWSTIGVQNFGRGRYPSPRYGEKTWFAHGYIFTTARTASATQQRQAAHIAHCWWHLTPADPQQLLIRNKQQRAPCRQ